MSLIRLLGTACGFYGGVSYGYGYFCEGYEGGRWQNGQFYYNRSVNCVNVTNVTNVTNIHNVYNTTVINNNANRISYNDGNGGISRRAQAARGQTRTPREDKSRQSHGRSHGQAWSVQQA